MTGFLDRFTKVHRLPGTFRAAMNYARRNDPHEPQQTTYADTMFILRHGKKAWRAWKECNERTSNQESETR